jgi:plasmid maintenance system antidote protein VapI
MQKPNVLVRKWLKAANPDQAREVAKFAKTSVAHLRHIGAGRRGMTPAMAMRLAHATFILYDADTGLRLDQQDLCAVCAKCPIAIKR